MGDSIVFATGLFFGHGRIMGIGGIVEVPWCIVVNGMCRCGTLK